MHLLGQGTELPTILCLQGASYDKGMNFSSHNGGWKDMVQQVDENDIRALGFYTTFYILSYFGKPPRTASGTLWASSIALKEREVGTKAKGEASFLSSPGEYTPQRLLPHLATAPDKLPQLVVVRYWRCWNTGLILVTNEPTNRGKCCATAEALQD